MNDAPGAGGGSFFKDCFSEVASTYAAFRPTYPPALVDYLTTLAAADVLVWECGCGSGQLTIPLARRFTRIIAADPSAAQLAGAPPHPHVEYRQARAETSGLPDGVVGLAVSAQAAHWFNLPAYFAEVRRTARPQALVAMICYGIHSVDEPIDAIVQPFYHDRLQSYWGPERRHVEAGYRTLPFPFAELDTPRFEIRTDWPLDRMLGYVESWSAVQALLKAEGRAPLNELHRELSRAWGEPGTVRTIRWPLSLRAGLV